MIGGGNDDEKGWDRIDENITVDIYIYIYINKNGFYIDYWN